ncbi:MULTISPECIES: hypoxanthine phosphoribosyltransferase [Porcipelethomonas]|jgi:hypoxanthine phosphoribosyltransferase|uniref:hypoxanthine phosphoribosyltransferase n=1 Tax=Porcipelethomonas TaxID=2981643 RepID=UPI000821A830|nr:hypoxanthine phosphoribosyltransferase [Porcipelethomonas ammoniilytica]MBS1324892.1 hypoxanthine phosphoribosyltransferase [Oscillospiraceae bacterium]MBS6314417.1 hypoxanthine phosphoribosyltransferase [Ruminococcus sp.]OLA69354.1 MAG: hypoxanthine phosphoribosyltransferase [Ruminococcus sp. 37_24]SCI61464.1 Hypoxanthine phosphoribosyltransferase [uncultured Ruminococcus sp.]MCU6718824.1 hypoxanthine phosphoribosyltransferase [Porcipelethomonas ammoniilytica]
MKLSEHEIKKVLFSAEEIKTRVAELGKILTEDYKNKNPLLICPLKGSIMFFSDIVREIKIPCEIDFMTVSSYNSNTVSSGEIKILKDLTENINGRHVLIIEDIIDTGLTLYNLKKMLSSRNPESLKICTLLDKPSRRIADIKGDYCGFVIPDKFVVGYGMDLNEKYRNLPFIGIYESENT